MLALPLLVLQWIGSLATFQGCHESTNRLVTLRLQVKKPIEGTKLWLVGDGVPVVGCTQNHLQDTWRKDGFSTQANSYFLQVWRCGHGRLESWHNKGPYILKFGSWKKQTEAGWIFPMGCVCFPIFQGNFLRFCHHWIATKIWKMQSQDPQGFTKNIKKPMTRPVINNRNPGVSRGAG